MIRCDFQLCMVMCDFQLCRIWCDFQLCIVMCDFQLCMIRCDFQLCMVRCDFQLCMVRCDFVFMSRVVSFLGLLLLVPLRMLTSASVYLWSGIDACRDLYSTQSDVFSLEAAI